MSKNKNKKNRPSNGNGNGNGNGGNSIGNGSISSNLPKVNEPNVFPKIEDAALKVSESLGEEAPEIISASVPPLAAVDSDSKDKLNAYLDDLNRFVREVAEVNRIHDAARKKYEGLQLEVIATKNSLESERDEIKVTKAEIEEQKTMQDKKELNLEEREQNARNKFKKQQEEVFSELKDQKAKLEQKKRELTAELDEMRDVANSQLEDELAKKRELLRVKEIGLDEKQIELDRIELKLKRDTARIDALQKDILEEKEQIRIDVEAKAQVSLDKLQLKLVTANSQLENAYKELGVLEKEITGYQDFNRALRGASVDEFLAQNDTIRKENRELRNQIEIAGDTDHVSENERLRMERDALCERVRNLESNHGAALAELHTSRIGVLDKERLEGEKRSLLLHKELLTVHLNDLDTRVTSLSKAHQAKRVFQQLSKMDEEDECQSVVATEPVPTLKQFAQDLRHRIAQAEGLPLYYDLDEIRLFMGGIAMSQLHIIEGMSGTGKTSLVKAFAKAVGGYCTDISVQAGWRDKHDIIGHFNTFEKKFYEKECLQALYRAQTPNFSDRINVILLDEMNLSRPEQYFAEFLSALEKNAAKERLIELREDELPDAPKLLVKSRWVRVPNNIWFMGTANHDETTNDFADKTQDRSYTMELSKCDPFDINQNESHITYSYKSLHKRFTDAARKHAEQVSEIMINLNDKGCELRKVLNNTFDIDWGNRLDLHARTFIPVVMETGDGSPELALDHLLATRVFRKGKVTGRFDTVIKNLNEVESALNKFWVGRKGKPQKCLELISKDRKLKERRGES